MRIIFYLMTHKNEQQISRLISRLLYNKNSLVVIHHDRKSDPLKIKENENIHILHDPLDLRWGHISQVYAIWKGFMWLESENIPFDWFILLSGQDYPIRPLSALETELEQTDFDGYVHHEIIHEDPVLHKRYFHTVCWRRYFFRRLKFPGIRALTIKRRHPFVRGVNCFAGSVWLNLSRKAVEYLWTQNRFYTELVKYHKLSSCPDETVFQTILLNRSGLNIHNSDRRFILWREDADHPETLRLEHLDQILSSNAWFTRKVDDVTSKQLLDRLDEIIIATR